MRRNSLLLIVLSLFLGACASKKQASRGKHTRNRPQSEAPDRSTRDDRSTRAGERPGRDSRPPSSPSRSLNTEEYIRLYSSLAVEEMERSGIPASITLAQGILESGNGNSRLARQANNHFGIKCTSDWKGGKTYKDDDRRNECFRVYRSARDSYRDHSEFLQRQRYRFLFNLKPTDYKGWARGLKQAGYATNPKYPQLLISLIERYELYYFDRRRRGKEEPVYVSKEPSTEGPASGEAPVPGEAPASGRETEELKPAASQASVPGEAAAGATSHYYYTVKQGDTLYAISKRFNVSMDELKNWNSLSSNTISTGQQLRVSR